MGDIKNAQSTADKDMKKMENNEKVIQELKMRVASLSDFQWRRNFRHFGVTEGIPARDPEKSVLE